MSKARGERRKAIRGSDWHYLLRVQENFESKDSPHRAKIGLINSYTIDLQGLNVR